MVTASTRQRLRARVRHAGWLLRYWVMDKYQERLRWYVFFAACCVTLVMCAVLVSGLLRRAVPDPYGTTVHADGGATIIIQIIIFVVSLAISYAMRPKVEQAKPQEGKVPDAEEGAAYERIYGTVWVDDSFWLGWKELGTEPIKSKGSKKWKPGLLPGTTNPIESWLDDKWNLSGLNDVDDPLGGGNHYPDEGEFDPDGP